MQAIRLTKKNFHKILQHSPIDKARLKKMVEEYDTPYINTAVFFIPQHDVAHSLDETSWATIPWKLLDQTYKYDHDKINTEFVEITHK